jgi:NitT/TauT family transport system substrate-binding protein
MKRRESLGVFAALALCRQRAGAQERRVLRAAGPPNDGFKAMYYGVRSGIFAKYGLTVEITPVNNGAAAAAALIGGDVDVAMVNILSLIQAHLRGVAMRMLAASFWANGEKPTTFLLVRKDSPIRSGRDLNGKTIALPGLGDLGSVGTKAWIDQTGGDSQTVRLLEVMISAVVPAMVQGRADAATISEPFASQALATGEVRVLAMPLDAIAKRFQGGAFVVMEPVVEKNLDAMRRLAQGLHESMVYTNSHLAETVDLVASYSGATPEIVAKMNRATDPEYVDVRNIQPVIEAMAKYGVIDKTFPADELVSAAALKGPR